MQTFPSDLDTLRTGTLSTEQCHLQISAQVIHTHTHAQQLICKNQPTNNSPVCLRFSRLHHALFKAASSSICVELTVIIWWEGVLWALCRF